MGIQGMELCAMAVVVLLFIAVLKQFGILEPMSMEVLVILLPVGLAKELLTLSGCHLLTRPVQENRRS